MCNKNFPIFDSPVTLPSRESCSLKKQEEKIEKNTCKSTVRHLDIVQLLLRTCPPSVFLL